MSGAWGAVSAGSRYGARISRKTGKAGCADESADCGCGCGYGHRSELVEIVPYLSRMRAGERREFEIQVRNHRKREVEMQVALALPKGWRSEPGTVRLRVGPLGSAKAKFGITIPQEFVARESRVAFAADVLADGRYLGQIAEAVVDVENAA